MLARLGRVPELFGLRVAAQVDRLADHLLRPVLRMIDRARDAKVLRLYFGLDDGQPRTLEEIGRMMGVTRERIRQLRDRALIRLREGETGERLKDLVA